MPDVAANVGKIIKSLKKIPPNKLGEVNDFIGFILYKYKHQPRKTVKFEGIWEGLGFEKITDLESEIRHFRKRTTEKIIERVEKWNI